MMSYQIIYSPEKNEKYPAAVPSRKRWGGAVLVVVALLAVFTAFMVGGRSEWKEILLPGDPEVTAQSLEILAEDIRGGESVKEAVAAFCVRIMEHGKAT